MSGRGKAIPTLGYPSRTEAILALTSQGLSDRQIAERLGMTKGGVSGLKSKWRTVRKNLPIKIPAYVRADLVREADRRGVSVDNLVGSLLRVVCSDRLFAALLDD